MKEDKAMAMIKCPECEREISDKAKKSIHCGKILIEETEVVNEIKCVECGALLNQDGEVCPNCGCPVEQPVTDNIVRPQQVEVASIKMTKKTKQIIIAAVVAVFVLIVGGVGVKIYSDAQAEQNYVENYNTYIDNLEKVQVLMITGGSEAETLCNLTLRVWYNAIYEERDSTTDKYTRPNGWWVDDFNEALSNLFADSSTKQTISSIESNQTTVKDLMKKLQNPPEGLDNCYDTVSDLYDAYTTLTELAINPSGNYSGFSGNKNDAVSEFMSAYEKLDSQIPEKIENK